MLIGIDASRANKPIKTGVEWYSYYLIEEFKKISPDQMREIVGTSDVKFVLYSNEELVGGLGKCPGNWRVKILNWPPVYLWTQIRLWWELMSHPPDVLFVPAHTIPFLPILPKTKIRVTVHDVGFKRSPRLYKKIQLLYHDWTMKKIRKRADVIITISEFSKREIADLYKVNPENIRVAPLGYDRHKCRLSPRPNPDTLEKYGVKTPYLFYIGRLEKKKNIEGIIRAFSLVLKNYPNLNLVLAGMPGNGFEDASALINSMGLENKIIIPKYIEAGDIAQVSGSAEALVFPTFYEGFGLPIIEAMACGLPIVTSDMNPHREVAGDAALFADPNKPDMIAMEIERLLSSPELKKQMIERGLERVKNYTWEKTARETLKILAG